MGELIDRIALITGGGKGIGRAIAESYAKEGAHVVLVSRTRKDLDEVAEAIRNEGGEATAIAADVSQEASVTALVNEVAETCGNIDILVNNAAVIHPKIDVIDFDFSEWKRMYANNVDSVFLMSKATLPTMIKNKYGRIIVLSSIGGRRGGAGRSAYRSTKAALINFVESLASEVYAHGIIVNGICPGAVYTDMHRLLGSKPEGMVKAEEIAQTALFLASERSTAVTGTSIDAFGSTNPLFRH